MCVCFTSPLQRSVCVLGGGCGGGCRVQRARGEGRGLVEVGERTVMDKHFLRGCVLSIELGFVVFFASIKVQSQANVASSLEQVARLVGTHRVCAAHVVFLPS